MDAGLVDEQSAQIMVTTIEAERGGEALVNEHEGLDVENGAGDGGGDDARPLAKLNARQLEELLHERERQMRQGGPDGEETDQWRVYKDRGCAGWPHSSQNDGPSQCWNWKEFSADFSIPLVLG